MTESKTIEVNSLSSRSSSGIRDMTNQSNNSNSLPEYYLVPSEKYENYLEKGFSHYSNEFKSISEI